MDNRKNTAGGQGDPKKLAPLLLFVLFFLINLIRSAGVGETSSEALILAVLFAIIGLSIAVFVTVAKKKMGESGNVKTFKSPAAAIQAQRVKRSAPGGIASPGEHSHDRLQTGSTAQECDDDSLLHWKKQLDGFLQAGIIDRSEYNTLLARYKSGT